MTIKTAEGCKALILNARKLTSNIDVTAAQWERTERSLAEAFILGPEEMQEAIMAQITEMSLRKPYMSKNWSLSDLLFS